MFKKIMLTIILVLGLGLIGAVEAANLKFDWEYANPGVYQVTGYNLYRSATSGVYTEPPLATIPACAEDVCTTTIQNFSIPGLSYFVVRAYTADGESQSSNEVQYLSLQAPTNLTITVVP
jgi:hypothetical protein